MRIRERLNTLQVNQDITCSYHLLSSPNDFHLFLAGVLDLCARKAPGNAAVNG